MSRASAAAGAAAAEPAPRFRDLLAAEWTKVWSLRSSYLVLGLGVVGVVLICVFAVHSDLPYLGAHPRPGSSGLPRAAGGPPPPALFAAHPYDPLRDSLDRFGSDLFLIVAAGFGGLAVAGEHAGGMARSTFAAVPDRRAVVLAKAVVVGTIMSAAGFAAALGAFLSAQAMLRPHHVGISLADPGAGRAVAAYALIAPVAALVGMALGALIRHGAATVAAAVGTLLLVPEFFGGDRYEWLKKTGELMPARALERLKFYPPSGDDLGRYPASVTTSWLVYLGWASVAVLIAVIVVERRDV